MTTKTELSAAEHAVRGYINQRAGAYASYISDDMVADICKLALSSAEEIRHKEKGASK